MNYLNKNDICILTAEKTIESLMEGINQVQIKDEIGYTYSKAFEDFVQQDPDIIMLQDLHNQEVAEKAFRAALDGFLIFSSLNTDDAAYSLSQLMEWGIQPALLCSSIRYIHAQRLVRKICENCKSAFAPSREQRDMLPVFRSAIYEEKWQSNLPEKMFLGSGCENCAGTGYAGRMPVCEGLKISDKIKAAILNKSSQKVLKKIAVEEGMETLSQNTLRKALNGETTLDECLRISLETDES
jgi:type II secretory ATPase GspE/PulE/Tfp pilus assembly ATPase PilB-like protein